MFSHKCGAQISEEATFCHKCGTKVVYTETAPQLIDTPEDTPEPAVSGSSTGAATTEAKLQATSLVENDQQATSQNEQTVMPPAGTEAAPKTFDVTLCAFPNENKVGVIKAIRTWAGLSLQDAKELAEHIPSVLKRAVTREDAELAKQVFTKVGATVSFTNQRGETEVMHSPQSVQQLPPAQDVPTQKGPSKFKSWWASCSKTKKYLLFWVLC